MLLPTSSISRACQGVIAVDLVPSATLSAQSGPSVKQPDNIPIVHPPPVPSQAQPTKRNTSHQSKPNATPSTNTASSSTGTLLRDVGGPFTADPARPNPLVVVCADAHPLPPHRNDLPRLRLRHRHRRLSRSGLLLLLLPAVQADRETLPWLSHPCLLSPGRSWCVLRPSPVGGRRGVRCRPFVHLLREGGKEKTRG